MVRQTAAVVTLELIGGALLLSIAAVVTLAFMLARGPVELNIFRADVERALEEARDGRDVEIGQLSLRWSPSERQMIVTADQLRLADSDGNMAAEASEALITLDAGSLVFGKTEILETELRDGWVLVTQRSPTQWTFAGEPLPEFEARKAPTSAEEWVQLSNRVLGQVLLGLRQTRRAGPLQVAAFSDMELRFISQDGESLGEMSGARGHFERADGGLQVRLAGSGTGLGLPGDVEASLDIPSDFDELSLTVGVNDWSIGDLAARLDLWADKISGFPADIGFGMIYDSETGISRIALNADAEAGELYLNKQRLAIQSLRFDTAYDPVADEIQIDQLGLESKLVTGELRGIISGAGEEETPIPFSLRSSGLSVDLTPYFPEGWEFPDLAVSGTLAPSLDTMELDEVSVRLGETSLSGDGRLAIAGPDADGALPFHFDLEGELDGALETADIFSYWPETLGRGARRFAVENVRAGRVTAANVRVSLKPDSFEQGYLRDEDLEVRFFVEDAEVSFLDDLPAVTNGVGSARLTGNGFSVQLNSGEFSGWQLTEGSVQFPHFNPKGEMFRVFARGSGPVVDIMDTLSESRLQLEAQTGFDPERLSGTGEMTFEMYRPMLTDVPIEDVSFSVHGEVTDAGLKSVLPGLDMTAAQAEVELEDNLLVVTGFGDVGPAPVQFAWRDVLDDDGGAADLSASAFISPDFLNRFGFVGRAYVSGDIPVELQAKVSAGGADTVEIGFELEQTRIDLSEIGWIKPAGDRARATLTYDDGINSSAATFQFQSEEASFDGDIELANDGRLELLTVRKAFLSDFIDVSGAISRTADQTFRSSLQGAFLDASAFFGDFSSVGGTTSAFSIPMTLNATLDTLRLREGLDLQAATLTFESTRAGVREVSAEGRINDGPGQIHADYYGPTAETPARINLQSDDAGFFMRGMMGQDFLDGGSLRLEGHLGRGNTPGQLNLRLENVRLREAPFLTQVLSLASLRGLADTLSGEGVLFTSIEMPIVMAGKRMIVEGARANGPALGLTLNGWYEQTSDEIRLSGVLVPSFGVNSMLGGVPIIGDLFVGREGEGIFSLTYSVRGTLDKAQVAVNPLSAVTPGILRRIFENPADTSIPDSLPVDPDRTPPAPPMPEAEFIPSAPGSDN